MKGKLYNLSVCEDYEEQQDALEELLDLLDDVGIPGPLAVIGRIQLWNGIRTGYKLNFLDYIPD